jgi:hypothetical protein
MHTVGHSVAVGEGLSRRGVTGKPSGPPLSAWEGSPSAAEIESLGLPKDAGLSSHPVRHPINCIVRTRGCGLLLAAAGLCLCICFGAGPVAASSSSGSRPAGVPAWVPQTIDHPTPLSDPLPVALTQEGRKGAPVVSVSQAAAVLSAVWNLRAQAFDADNRSLMAEFETGPALEADEVTCGCNTRGVRGSIDADTLLVPKQLGYPAAFLAEVKTTLSNKPYVQYLVIARQSSATPWEVVADPGQPGSRALDSPQSGRDGFDDVVASHAAADRLPSRLASYWHAWTEDDHAPSDSPFASGEWTTKAGATYAKDPSGAFSPQNGLIGYYSFKGGSDHEVWSFGTRSGTITCGVVRWQTIWTYPGEGVYQDPAQNNWGASVAPGNYRYEAETWIMQPCFVQHPDTPVVVVSGLGDPDTDQGVDPLPATPTTPTPSISPVTPPIASA